MSDRQFPNHSSNKQGGVENIATRYTLRLFKILIDIISAQPESVNLCIDSPGHTQQSIWLHCSLAKSPYLLICIDKYEQVPPCPMEKNKSNYHVS